MNDIYKYALISSKSGATFVIYCTLQMLNIYKRKRLAVITAVYWFLLLYIIAALVWWYISLQTQNTQMYEYRVAQLKRDDFLYGQKLEAIEQNKHAKTVQYIGEGFIFLIVILVGAVFVYRAVRRQIRLSQQQQNFMMAVTHELKTPLAVVNLNLETLQKRKLEPEQQQRIIYNTLQEAGRLNSLTNNILVASQMESGNYHVHSEETNFSELADGCVKAFTMRFPQRAIESNVQPGIFVSGETLLLQMLCSNLLDNALKYSPKDAVVHVSLVAGEQQCLFSVADEGNGIDDAEKKKVFEKFYRTGNETTRTAQGTGLGLYLCKRIAKDHGGQITIRDNTPRGSIFTVSLPQA